MAASPSWRRTQSSLPIRISRGYIESAAAPDEQRFAVNLSPAESNTAPLDLEQLEQLGVKTGTALSKSERLERIRQQRDTELESRQKIWRWLIVAHLGYWFWRRLWAGVATRQIALVESNSAESLA